MNRLRTTQFRQSVLPFVDKFSLNWVDGLIVFGLVIAIAILTYLGTNQIPNPIFQDFYAQDVWFGADIPTVFGNITSFKSDFGRNNKHPLFPLIVFPIVYGLGKLLGLEPISAVRVLIVITAILWIGLLYLLLRVMGCFRLDATLLSLLGGVSAAAIFWLVTPESFSLGSVTILLGLIFTVLTQYRTLPALWYVGINVITVSITITNAMVSIFATLINQRWQRLIQIGIAALGLSTGLWILQRILFVNTGFPFQPGTFIGEKKFMTAPVQHDFLAYTSAFFYETMILPAAQFLPFPLRPDWVKIAFNPLALTTGGWLGAIAVFCWTGLLILGVGGFIFSRGNPKLRIVLGLTLVVQFGIHSIYGVEETFLYTLHFAPLLITLVAFSCLTRWRPLSLLLVTLLILSAGITNRTQFNQVTAELWNHGTAQQQLEAQIKLRPGDPWPRSSGHVILAATGSALESKAWHEPGGSFSPKLGSFGVAIWMVDRQGKLKATSDTIPPGEIRQQLIPAANSKIPPGIATVTPYYQSSWVAVAANGWRLQLSQIGNSEVKPVVVIRSAGPAGGPIRSLSWQGQRLVINNRWVVRNLPGGVQVYLGSEGSPGWMDQKPKVTEWQDERGWGYARLELNQDQPWTLEIADLQSEPSLELKIASAPTRPILNLPDPQFQASLTNQIEHLLMGLVGNQTRPGDPLAYPLPRFREGAYETVALARTGNLEVARQLVPYFAATDFTNGVQPEADIPALGVWVLTTVAQQVNQPDYDQQLWPDVQRKAELIVDLIASHRPGYPIATAAKIPFAEYPDFWRTDLVAGRMDALPGLITLDPAANLMSYRALLDAATLAERLQQSELAQRWRSQAAQLQAAWQAAFTPRFASLEATYTTGLWPAWMATTNQEAFQSALEARWQTTYNPQGQLRQSPQNTSPTLAEAHQWLYLNRSDRVWTALRWFWQNQASPGLYTWGDQDPGGGGPLPASLSQWQRFRGWVHPPNFTPSYTTAAEMLLLQLDMLAYSNPTAATPTVVLGAGVPQEWLKQPLSVKGLRINGAVVNWTWDGKQMTVQISGKQLSVKLGNAFPVGTPVKLTIANPVEKELDLTKS